jgi:hypothetical protein
MDAMMKGKIINKSGLSYLMFSYHLLRFYVYVLFDQRTHFLIFRDISYRIYVAETGIAFIRPY